MTQYKEATRPYLWADSRYTTMEKAGSEARYLAVAHRILATGAGIQLRRVAGLSRSDFARRLKVTAKTLGRWERREGYPKPHNAMAYAALCLEIEEDRAQSGRSVQPFRSIAGHV